MKARGAVAVHADDSRPRQHVAERIYHDARARG